MSADFLCCAVISHAFVLDGIDIGHDEVAEPFRRSTPLIPPM